MEEYQRGTNGEQGSGTKTRRGGERESEAKRERERSAYGKEKEREISIRKEDQERDQHPPDGRVSARYQWRARFGNWMEEYQQGTNGEQGSETKTRRGGKRERVRQTERDQYLESRKREREAEREASRIGAKTRRGGRTRP